MKRILDEGHKDWIADRRSITCVDRFPEVSVEELRDPKRVDLVRKVNAEFTRSDGYVQELMDDLAENGLEEPLSVFVEIDGSITLSDGTHRAYCAHQLGWKWIRAEVRYFGNSQRTHGLLTYREPCPLPKKE